MLERKAIMNLRAENEEAPEARETGEKRWSNILQEVGEEYKIEGPWWRRLGVFLAWAGGLAVAAGVLATIVLLIVDLPVRS